MNRDQENGPADVSNPLRTALKNAERAFESIAGSSSAGMVRDFARRQAVIVRAALEGKDPPEEAYAVVVNDYVSELQRLRHALEEIRDTARGDGDLRLAEFAHSTLGDHTSRWRPTGVYQYTDPELGDILLAGPVGQQVWTRRVSDDGELYGRYASPLEAMKAAEKAKVK